MTAIDDSPGDDLDDVDIPIGEGDEAVSPLSEREWIAASSSAALAILLILASAYFGGRGMLGRAPITSIHILESLIPVAVVVWLYAARALKITRAHEGTVARGLALTAVVVSSLSILLLSWSEFSLVSAQVGR